jgi:tRNA(Ile)-lysidine synthase
VSELPDHLEQCIRTRRLFRPGERILVAVSGGADSMVLLHLLHGLAAKHRWQLTVAHFNHQLRGRSSTADERLVRRTAERLKLPVLVEGADVRQSAHTLKLSLEMAARKLRHHFLAATAAQLGIPSIALAHHADDQLELFFLRLLRGSGGEGLAGMKWRNPSPSDPEIELVRPLLDQPKAMLIEYAAEQGISYREDASNAVLDFQRNRIRHELLPLLRRKYQPALDRTIPRVMEIVGAETEFAAAAAREWIRGGGSPKSKVQSPKCGEVRGPFSRLARGQVGRRAGLAFEELPVAVQRRCVQFQLLSQGVVADFELVEQLRLAADRPVPVSRAQAQRDARRTSGRPVPLCAVRDRLGLVHLQAAEAEEFKTDSAAVYLEDRAGEVEFDGARIWWRIHSRGAAGQPKARVECECFDADKVGSPVWLRHWRPGDRFQPIGMTRPVKLQDFFTNQKVPRGRRRQLTLAATAKGEVFWVEGMRISERFKLSNQTIRRLQWRWERL